MMNLTWFDLGFDKLCPAKLQELVDLSSCHLGLVVDDGELFDYIIREYYQREVTARNETENRRTISSCVCVAVSFDLFECWCHTIHLSIRCSFLDDLLLNVISDFVEERF